MVVKRPGADNNILCAEISGEPIFDSLGHFKGYCGVGRDITESMHAEELRREVNARVEGGAPPNSSGG